MPTTSAAYELVADLLDAAGGSKPPRRDMADPMAARDRLSGYLQRRVEAITEACPGEPTLLLSGGIDSMLLAAAWSRFGPKPLCVTVTSKALIDKFCLRDLAAEWTVPLVWSPKDPMQFSSGVVKAFTKLARQHITDDSTQHAYVDPRSEPSGTLAARLWLKHCAR